MVAASVDTRRQGLSGRVIDLIPFAMGLGVLVAAFVIAFLPSILWILKEWSGSSGVLSHGYLVAAISIYLFVRAIPQAATTKQEPMWSLLPVLLLLSTIWLLGDAATIIAVQTVVLPVTLLAAIAMVFGLAVAHKFVFSVLFIYFAIPAIEHLQSFFQAFTVLAVSLLIRLTDVPALVEGNTVFIPQGSFEIAGGCSGLNYVVAGLSLAVFYGHLFYTRIKQNLRLLVVVLVVTMFGNWIRVFSVIVIGYQSNMQSTLVQDHLTMGWLIFAILMIPVYFFAQRLEGANLRDTRNPGIKVRGVNNDSPNRMAVVIAIIAMVSGPVWASTISTPRPSTGSLAIEFPAETLGWGGPNQSNWGWQPNFKNPTAESVVEYRAGSDVVLVYANYYQSQEQDRELIYFSNEIGGGWRDSSEGLSETVFLDDGTEYGQVGARNYVGDWLIWYRYQHGDRFDASAERAKLSQALQTLKGNSAAGIAAFATPCRGQCETASDRLATFIHQVGYKINLSIVKEQQ